MGTRVASDAAKRVWVMFVSHFFPKRTHISRFSALLPRLRPGIGCGGLELVLGGLLSCIFSPVARTRRAGPPAKRGFFAPFDVLIGGVGFLLLEKSVALYTRVQRVKVLDVLSEKIGIFVK